MISHIGDDIHKKDSTVKVIIAEEETERAVHISNFYINDKT